MNGKKEKEEERNRGQYGVDVFGDLLLSARRIDASQSTEAADSSRRPR